MQRHLSAVAAVLLAFAGSASAQVVQQSEKWVSYKWANAQVVACGAVTSCNKTVATLPARTIVKHALLIVTGQGAGTTTLTGSVGRVSSTYVDYVPASSLKAAASTIYGDASGEEGAGLGSFVGDVLSLSATTDVILQFVSTGANLSSVTGSTGEVQLYIQSLPQAVQFPTGPLNLSLPLPNQIVQRASLSGGVPIVGVIPDAGAYDIEASFNGGAWSTVSTAETGTFSLVLDSQSSTHGTLKVRRVDRPEIVTEVPNIDVGEIFVLAGQSNASCSTINAQVYAGSKTGFLYGNDGKWHSIADCVDDWTGQVDEISKDTAVSAPGAGSVWPRLSTAVANAQNVPVGIIPCAKGGSSMAAWAPSVCTDRSTLYCNCEQRVREVGSARAWLWWQGEADGIAGTSRASYNAQLDTLANTVMTNLGIKTMPFRLQACGSIPDANEALIRGAIDDAVADNTNVVAGPDLSDLVADDGFHIRTDVNLAIVSSRAYTALANAYGW